MNLKVGDVVRLKSGGPYMTVTSVSGDKVWCAWFPTKESAPSHTDFVIAALEVAAISQVR